MKDIVRYIALGVAAIAVVVILSVWKKQDRAEALERLESVYGAEVSITEEDFWVGCSSERLVNLKEFSRLLARVGSPTILDLTGAPKLESFAGVEVLTDLHTLISIDCPALTMALGVTRHPSLRELVFTDSTRFSDASAIRDLPALETIDFSGCLALEEVNMENLPSLESLFLSRCVRVAGLDVSGFRNLRMLYLDGCHGLTSLEGLEELDALTDLDVSNASRLRNLEGLESLSSLVVLDLRNVDLADYDAIGQLPSLRVLRMGGQDNLTNLRPFSGLSGLKEIHLEACPNLESLEGIPSSVSQYAGFTHCPKLTSLAGLEAAQGLEQLDVTGCRNLSDVSALGELRNLVQLSLVNCRRVTDISGIENMERLVIVMLGGSGVIPASVKELDLGNPEVIFDFAVGG